MWLRVRNAAMFHGPDGPSLTMCDTSTVIAVPSSCRDVALRIECVVLPPPLAWRVVCMCMCMYMCLYMCVCACSREEARLSPPHQWLLVCVGLCAQRLQQHLSRCDCKSAAAAGARVPNRLGGGGEQSGAGMGVNDAWHGTHCPLPLARCTASNSPPPSPHPASHPHFAPSHVWT